MSFSSPAARPSLLLTALLVTLLTVAVTVSGCAMTGCNFFNTAYYYDTSYTVTITGMNNYTGIEGLRVLVPIPVINGTPVYTEGQIRAATLIFPPPVSAFADYQTVHESRLVNNTGWAASIVETEHGPMIALSSTNASLSDVMLILGATREVPAAELGIYQNRVSGDSPMYPVSQEFGGNYTIPVNDSRRSYYSYIFIDGVPTPRQDETAGNLSVNAEYHELFAEGSVPAFRQSCQINKSIPAGITGWIPVTVQITE